MDPVLTTRARRHWPNFVIIAIVGLFLAAQALVYAPLAGRYRRALVRAGDLGVLLDPTRGVMPAALSPRVYAFLMENSAPASDVDGRAQAGTLGAELVQRLSSQATELHLDVVVAEPGSVTQQPGWNEARAHLRMRGTWANYLRFLDALSRDGRLVTIERFAISPEGPGACDIEVWVSGATLKRRRPTP